MNNLTIEDIELIEIAIDAWRSDRYVGESSTWEDVRKLEHKLSRMKSLLTPAQPELTNACPACEHCDISGDDGCLDCEDFVEWQAETSQSG